MAQLRLTALRGIRDRYCSGRAGRCRCLVSLIEGEGRVRAALLLLVSVIVAGCSGDKPASTGSTISPETLKKECADPQWKEQNLGLWYSVCRQPLRW